jgi:TolB-like protein/class 3 adenylate cyclase
MANEDFDRKLTAIMSADVAGYSRLMGDDEAATVSTLKSHRNLITEKVQAYKGRVIDSPGDNILAEFRSIVDAVSCAVEVQKVLKEKNDDLPEERKMVFRIGVNLGDVIHDGDRIYGDGVNIAARIESLAKPGDVAISGTAFDSVRNKLKFGFEFVGEHQVKNIAQPVRVYRVLTDPASSGKIIGEPEGDRSTMPKTILAVAVVIFLLGATFFYISNIPTKDISTTEAKKPSIAVLPFTNMSDDPQQEYFSDGMTDDLITDLSKVSGLMVISRNSAFTYKGQSVQIKNVAKELGVKYVLEGSVRKMGDQIRINAQLIDAGKDHHVWAERYDGQMADVFDLQDQIRRKIVSALAVNLTDQEKGSHKEDETKNIQAYDAFLKGWNYFLQQTPEDVPKAIPLLKKAIELDPEYNRAYAALAYVYWRSVDQGWRKQLKLSPAAARLLANDYLGKAMKKPNSTAYALAAEVSNRMFLIEEAFSYAQKAISLAPNDHWSVFVMGHQVITSGKAKEGLAYLRKALELDPHNPGRIWQSMSIGEFCLGNYEKSISLGERSREFNPTMTSVGAALAISYAKLGQQQKAEEAFELWKKGWPKWLPPNIPLAMMFFNFSDPDISEAVVESMVKAGLPTEPSDYYQPWMLERLTDEEIKKLLLSRTITGMSLFSGKQWYWEINGDGGFKARGGNYGNNMDGSLWIEDNLLISIIPKMTKGLKLKGAVYKNKEGSKDKYNDYLIAAIWGLMPFSIVTENVLSSN